MTPLHYAVNNEDCVRLLIKRGADVNAVSFLNQTPLMTATIGSKICSKLFIDNGVDVNAEHFYFDKKKEYIECMKGTPWKY